MGSRSVDGACGSTSDEESTGIREAQVYITHTYEQLIAISKCSIIICTYNILYTNILL